MSSEDDISMNSSDHGSQPSSSGDNDSPNHPNDEDVISDVTKKCVRNFPLGKSTNDDNTGLELETVMSIDTNSNDLRVVKLQGGDKLTERKRLHSDSGVHVDTFHSLMLENDNRQVPFTVTNSIHETAHKQPIYATAFNHYQDGNIAIFATAAKDMINVYECTFDSPEMVLARTFVDDNVEESFFAITWCYDIVDKNSVLVIAGNSAFVKIVEPVSGNLLQELWGHGDVVNELRTDPNNSMIFASVSKDTTVRIWNIRSHTCLLVFGGVDGHLDQVLSCDWSPDSRFIVSCGMDHSVRMWHINDEAQKLIEYSMTPEGENDLKNHMPGSGHELLTIHIHYPNSWTTDLHCDYVDCVRFIGWHILSKGSERAANLYRFGHVDEPVDRIYDINADSACTRIAQLNLPECDVWFLKFDIDPVGRWVAFGSKSGEIYFFNMLDREFPEGEPDFIVKASASPIRQVSFGAGGRLLVAVTDDFTVIRLERNFKKFEVAKRLKMSSSEFDIKDFCFIVRAATDDNDAPSSFLRVTIKYKGSDITKEVPMTPETYTKFVEDPSAVIRDYKLLA